MDTRHRPTPRRRCQARGVCSGILPAPIGTGRRRRRTLQQSRHAHEQSKTEPLSPQCGGALLRRGGHHFTEPPVPAVKARPPHPRGLGDRRRGRRTAAEPGPGRYCVRARRRKTGLGYCFSRGTSAIESRRAQDRLLLPVAWLAATNGRCVRATHRDCAAARDRISRGRRWSAFHPFHVPSEISESMA